MGRSGNGAGILFENSIGRRTTIALLTKTGMGLLHKNGRKLESQAQSFSQNLRKASRNKVRVSRTASYTCKVHLDWL